MSANGTSAIPSVFWMVRRRGAEGDEYWEHVFDEQLVERFSAEHFEIVECRSVVPGERTARQHLHDALTQAGLASAPERLWAPDKQTEETAWLKGRDDTVAHVEDELSGLPESLTHALPDPCTKGDQ